MISIIIPVYNSEKYLKKCLDSVINQSYKDIEIILINDGSSDSSGKICDEYSINDNRIVVIHKKNEGVSEARNKGLDIANGEYIGFVDSDDWIHKDMYLNLVSAMRRFDADIAECRRIKVTSDYTDGKSIDNINYLLLTNVEASEDLFTYNSRNLVSLWNKLYKKELFNGLEFKAFIHEDNFVTYKLYYKANRIIYLDSTMYYYNNNLNSLTNAKYNINRLAGMRAFIEAMNFYDEKKLSRLHDLALSALLNVIRRDYYLAHQHVEKNIKKQCKNTLYSCLKKYFWEAIKSKNIDKKLKIKTTVLLIIPRLYVIYLGTKRKNKKIWINE